MKNLIETTLIDGSRALVNVNGISLVTETSGETEPELEHLSISAEMRYTFLRVNGEPQRLASCDDYDTIMKKITEAQEDVR